MCLMNKILAIALIVLLTGCSIGGEMRIKLFAVEEPRQKLNLPDPMPLTLEDIRWIIITSENAQEVFKKLEEQGIFFVGIDVIGGMLIEVNVTSPTGLQEMSRFADTPYHHQIIQALES